MDFINFISSSALVMSIFPFLNLDIVNDRIADYIALVIGALLIVLINFVIEVIRKGIRKSDLDDDQKERLEEELDKATKKLKLEEKEGGNDERENKQNTRNTGPNKDTGTGK